MKKKNLLKNDAVQSLLASLGCIVFGLLVGYIVLLFIQPKGAGKAILTIIENFFTYNRAETQMKYLGSTLVKTAPLLMCSLSILFAYKVGLFNIGAAGQYVVGSCASLYAALAWGWSWLPCMLFAVAAGMAAGAIVGLLKTFCNVNEVISGIMLNWIFLYATNMILTNVKEVQSPYTYQMHSAAQRRCCRRSGIDQALQRQPVCHHAIPLAILMAISCGSCWKRPASAMSSRRPASTSTPPNTAAWPSGATPCSRLPSRAALRRSAVAAVPDLAMSSGSARTPPCRTWALTASAPRSSAA